MTRRSAETTGDAARKAASGTRDVLWAEVKRLKAENERLRAVLKQVHTGDCQEMPPRPLGCDCPDCAIERALSE